METILKQEELFKQTVMEISEQLAEPQWLRKRRLRALKIFNRTPWPTGKEEEWRKTKILHFQNERYPVPESAFWKPGKNVFTRIPAPVSAFLEEAARYAGILVQTDALPVQKYLGEEEAHRHLVIDDLPTAARKYPEWVEAYFMNRVITPEQGKLEALHGAFWNIGAFVRIPEGSAFEKPIHIAYHFTGKEQSLYPHTLVVAEPNSRATIIETVTTDEMEAPVFLNRQIEIFAGEGACLDYMVIQLEHSAETVYSAFRSTLKKDSSVNWRLFSFCGKTSKTHLEIDLEEEGATADVQGIFLGGDHQHLDFNTIQKHLKSRTRSTLLLKGAVTGHSKSAFRGVIHIDPNAQKTDAYQLNNNLLLSKNAQADANPVLEIEANDIRCTHGATAGQLDDSQLFYLQTRGLPLKLAKRLIVEGYFKTIVDLLPNDTLKNAVYDEIGRKLND
ncbi:feS cluster assembly protein SufD [bacterium BMS3Abin05]|nr:feS cluster assembly protein SufD [bacterium BMS3Abin05]GBE27361.1 feS cluster assembly protein SufD [bacterium BMS3Bbin03]HDZ10896.1 Fe-S cluster assembly protein SufD [Bacteroidota bacterium]